MSKVPIPVKSTRQANDATLEGEQVLLAEEASAVEEAIPETEPEAESAEVWRNRALRLQAEMENYRKRQRRWAEAQIAAERERLLRALTHLADNLKRALESKPGDVQSLYAGVELTHHAFMQFLERERVIPLDPEGKRFDPEVHEAVGTVPHQDAGVKAETVVEVLEQGYVVDDRLLRPARVIVAV
jgi:molecular chaperone GrpE